MALYGGAVLAAGLLAALVAVALYQHRCSPTYAAYDVGGGDCGDGNGADRTEDALQEDKRDCIQFVSVKTA